MEAGGTSDAPSSHVQAASSARRGGKEINDALDGWGGEALSSGTTAPHHNIKFGLTGWE